MITLYAIHGSQVFHTASRNPADGPLCGRGKDSAVVQVVVPGGDDARAEFTAKRARRHCAGCARKLRVELRNAEGMAHAVVSVVTTMALPTSSPTRALGMYGQDVTDAMVETGLLEVVPALPNDVAIIAPTYALTDFGRRVAGVDDWHGSWYVEESAALPSAPLLSDEPVTADLEAKGLVFGAVRPSLPEHAGDPRCPVKLAPRTDDDDEPWIVVESDGSPLELDAHDREAGFLPARFAHHEVDPFTSVEQAVHAHTIHLFAEIDAQLTRDQRRLIDGDPTDAGVIAREAGVWVTTTMRPFSTSLRELENLGLVYAVAGHHFLTQRGANLATYRRLFVTQPSAELMAEIDTADSSAVSPKMIVTLVELFRGEMWHVLRYSHTNTIRALIARKFVGYHSIGHGYALAPAGMAWLIENRHAVVAPDGTWIAATAEQMTHEQVIAHLDRYEKSAGWTVAPPMP